MPFGSHRAAHGILTDTRLISTAQTLHLSPEKNLAGTVASKGVDRNNARHQGSVYHPLMLAIAVDARITTNVSIDVDHGDGTAFDFDLVGLTPFGVFVATDTDGIIFDLDGDFPGLLIYPKGDRAAPDSLRVLIALSDGDTASTTFTYEILE